MSTQEKTCCPYLWANLHYYQALNEHKQNVKIFETFEKCSFLFKFKEAENFNHRNTWSTSRIKLKLHFVHNVETDAEIGQKGEFCEGLYLS